MTVHAERRIDALGALLLPQLRESAGRHEYDGRVPDLSPEGVRAGLANLGGEALADPHDEAHLRAFEELCQVTFGEAELQRRTPRPLLAALDLSGYDAPYAAVEERRAARRRHLEAWPPAIDAGLASLDRLSAPVARALLPAVRGLASSLDAGVAPDARALAAHRRLVVRLEQAGEGGDDGVALGSAALARLLGAGERCEVDLAALLERANRERERLNAMLSEACAAISPHEPVPSLVHRLLDDHPGAAGVLDAARELTEEVVAFTRERGLVDGIDGACEVAPSPPSRRWATAMLSWAAPYETDGPSRYLITPPDPGWSPERQRQWLRAFSTTTLPATTVHEVAPGHFAHGRWLRRARGPVRRSLFSSAFVEGWAHYAEELLVEEGFRAQDPRFAAGVALKALLRVTRLAVAIGVHSGDLTVPEAAERFESDAFYPPPAAQAEANRATFDPTYGRYTWGKLEILELREQARQRWGPAFSLPRFHHALLDLGAPPLGLMRALLDRGDSLRAAPSS